MFDMSTLRHTQGRPPVNTPRFDISCMMVWSMYAIHIFMEGYRTKCRSQKFLRSNHFLLCCAQQNGGQGANNED